MLCNIDSEVVEIPPDVAAICSIVFLNENGINNLPGSLNTTDFSVIGFSGGGGGFLSLLSHPERVTAEINRRAENVLYANDLLIILCMMSLQKISVVHNNCQRFYDGEWICTASFVTIIPER
ncbi:MAG: hypothetical protein IPP22_14470 [Nitrosomonas sp.]|nr:hypothetical protein [Nitrosomonas sp.]